MSEIIPELKLTFLEGTNPKEYALNVKVNQQEAHPHLMIDHDGGNMSTPNSQYVVVIEMGDAAEGASELDVNMGPLTFDSEESQVDVLLKLDGATIGGDTIKVKEAQQESRPIPNGF